MERGPKHYPGATEVGGQGPRANTGYIKFTLCLHHFFFEIPHLTCLKIGPLIYEAHSMIIIMTIYSYIHYRPLPPMIYTYFIVFPINQAGRPPHVIPKQLLVFPGFPNGEIDQTNLDLLICGLFLAL